MAEYSESSSSSRSHVYDKAFNLPIFALFIFQSTECEVFLSTVMKLVDGDRSQWRRALALEVILKVIGHPDLLK